MRELKVVEQDQQTLGQVSSVVYNVSLHRVQSMKGAVFDMVIGTYTRFEFGQVHE